MARFGENITSYLMIGRKERIDKLVELHKDIYQSRGHFIRSAIERQIRVDEGLNTKNQDLKDSRRSKLMDTEE